jgi:hypothetical protein
VPEHARLDDDRIALEERRMSITAQLRATAYHEAGHAVVALHRGDRTPRRVTIVRKGGILGSVTHAAWGRRFRPDVDLTPRRIRQLQASIDTLLAGVIAERRGTGRRQNWAGATSDLNRAVGLADYLNSSSRQVDLYLAWRQQCVRDQVEILWPDIERVAGALLARSNLDGDELRQIVFPARAGDRDPAAGGSTGKGR